MVMTSYLNMPLGLFNTTLNHPHLSSNLPLDNKTPPLFQSIDSTNIDQIKLKNKFTLKKSEEFSNDYGSNTIKLNSDQIVKDNIIR